ncbi:glycosyltransferase [Candidatus Microgenomates bacterium]|nr:glycosyltransferase [Candidatus Microgenomates bacterium]
MKKISLILLLLNGERFLPKLLTVLDNQQGDFSLELIVVDSASSDKTWEIVSSLPAGKAGIKYQVLSKKTKIINNIKVFKIKKENFSHGGTRNLAVHKATGEIVVFLSQDALPVDKYWLQNLVNHLTNPQIAGVFGRQLPREETNPIEKYFYSISYPQESRVIDQNSDLNFSNQNLFFSNVNAAVRRDLLLKFPFRNDLVMSEDQYWGREVISAGYNIVYEPQATVFHSHNYNLPGLAQRYFLSGRSQKQLNLKGKQMQKGIDTSLGLIKYLLLNKPLLLPYSLLYLAIKGGAFFLGKNSR